MLKLIRLVPLISRDHFPPVSKHYKQQLSHRRCITDNIIESLERMRRYLKKMKPTDDYVRGYKDAKLMMDETLKEAIEYITEVEDAKP